MFMNFKYVLLYAVCCAFLITGCHKSQPPKLKYIKTPQGVISYAYGYCQLGMLVTNDSVNIYDADNKPITCSGYVYLTREQAENYSNEGE